ncbi:MAG: efflux RND transporter periplasmic adaptor subunit [Beijerinckiaceae bacterium]
MIFGSAAKSLITLAVAGVAAAVVWPGLADYVYPGGGKQAASMREYLPGPVASALPAYGDPKKPAAAGAPAAGRPAGGPPGGGGRGRGPRRPVPVIVGKATKGEVPFLIEALGTTRPYATVNIRSRVDSTIQKIHVKDGARVKAGDVLVTLDSRQIDAQIRQAEAALAKDIAENAQAKRDVQRFTELLSRNTGTRVNLENARLKVATTAAAIAADRAQIDNLKVQRTYYTISAPISGRIGIFNAKEGNTIRAGDNSATGNLVTINQTSPLYVSFSLPQAFLPQVRTAIETGVGEVTAKPQGSQKSVKGKLTLTENAIDTATGTVVVHALFENADETLWPGQLCDLRVILRRDEGVVSVPREAIQSGQEGNFVFVIDNGTAKVKPVTILRSQEGREILSAGLNGDETIVIDGALSLRSGSAVQIRNTPANGTAKKDS